MWEEVKEAREMGEVGLMGRNRQGGSRWKSSKGEGRKMML